MKQILWGTDLHYNFLDDDEIAKFHEYQKILLKGRSAKFTALSDTAETVDTKCIVVSGDISEGHQLIDHLKALHSQMNLPVYYVCGNHDYWGTSFSSLRPQLIELANSSDIKWLGAVDYVRLDDAHALVGHDGWYDAMLGDWKGSRFVMNDWFKIGEFLGLYEQELITRLRETALFSAKHIDNGIDKAIAAGFKQLIIVTHVPPFQDIAAYRGRPTEAHALPWYTSGIMGDHIMQKAIENPHVQFTVFCGHTHDAMSKKICNNLIAHCGAAAYGHPAFHDVALVNT